MLVAQVPASCPPTRWLLDYASPMDMPVLAGLELQPGPGLVVAPNATQHGPDPRPFLYALGATKAWLLNRTAHHNPFSSNYFAYIDADYCRSDAGLGLGLGPSCGHAATIDAGRLVEAFERDDAPDRPHLRRDEGKRLAAETAAAGAWTEQLRRTRLQLDAAQAAGVAVEDRPGFVPQHLSPCAFPPKRSKSKNSTVVLEAAAAVAAHARSCPRPSPSQPFPLVWHPHPSTEALGAGTPARRRHMLLLQSTDRVEADPAQACPLPLARLLVPAAGAGAGPGPARARPPSRNHHFSGAFIVGSGPAARWFAHLYQSSLRAYERLGWFWGDEQTVLNTLASAFPHSFLQLESFALEGRCGSALHFLPHYFQPEGATRLSTCDKFAERMVTRVADRCVLP